MEAVDVESQALASKDSEISFKKSILEVNVVFNNGKEEFDYSAHIKIAPDYKHITTTEKDLIDSITSVVRDLSDKAGGSSCKFEVKMHNIAMTLVNFDNIRNFKRRFDNYTDGTEATVLSIEVENPLTNSSELLDVMWIGQYYRGIMSLEVESLQELPPLWEEITKKLEIE